MVRAGGTGQVVLVYNGELYNTDPLRRELEKRGHVFTTRRIPRWCWRPGGPTATDGEHLEGIYAFAIWDEAHRKLFCCGTGLG